MFDNTSSTVTAPVVAAVCHGWRTFTSERTNRNAGPAFYTMGAVSFGLQFGGQATEVVILINSQKGIDGMMTNAVKLGGDVSVAAGAVGTGQATNLTADFVSYSKAKGAFIGTSVEGSVLDVRLPTSRGAPRPDGASTDGAHPLHCCHC